MSFARYAAGLPGLDIRGLMAVMPDLRDEDALRPHFKHMRRIGMSSFNVKRSLIQRLKSFQWGCPVIMS